MRHSSLFERYQELQGYVGWTELDARSIQSIAGRLEGAFHAIVVDFYEEIDRHPEARKVVSGGAAQVERLKTSLLGWLNDLFCGVYDADYVQRRWSVGLRHAELGLDQVFCNMAMARVRSGLLDALVRAWDREPADLRPAVLALNKLLDLDLAIIEDAYQTEHLARQQQIERLAGLGQIAAGVAHELRNPLNVIKTSVYFLQSARDPTAEKKAEHFRRIERHVELADGVISALLNFARISAPQPRPFSVGACIREVLNQTGLRETVEVALLGLDPLPAVAADAGQIEIVFSNLFRNAREAMSGNGRLTITGRTDGPFVEIDVTDSGPGIPPDQIARVMEPFFTTKARGLGLGLAISRSIAERNQGDLRVISEPGSGSTFLVRLPAASPPAHHARQPL
ncbi:MAG: sensor histidine kinase [Isosphaeraceae bacterium]